MDTFVFDSERERQLAMKIESLSEKLTGISSRLSETAGGIAGCWKSDNSASYVEKCAILEERVRETAADLLLIAEDAEISIKIKETGAAENTGLGSNEKR